MSGVLSRDWLLTETPASRAQAAWVRRYRGWLQFRANGLAMVGLVTVAIMIVASLAAPLLAWQDPSAQNLAGRLAPPSLAHWFGTDELGRDIYARILYGGRVTLGMVVAVVLLVAPVGLAVGSVAGYLGGLADRVLMRVTDVFLAFPRLVLALAFVAALKPGITSAIIAIALTAWPPYARLARADTLTVRNSDFIAAVRLTGASSGRIILRHIMPLCLSSVIVRVTLDMSGIILTAAALGFLGMGAQPPMPEWGTMIASSRAFILDQWWVPTIPGIAIFIASLAFNLLGDGMRDVLDPTAALDAGRNPQSTHPVPHRHRPFRSRSQCLAHARPGKTWHRRRVRLRQVADRALHSAPAAIQCGRHGRQAGIRRHRRAARRREGRCAASVARALG